MTGIKLVAILKKESSLEHSETQLWYIDHILFQYTSKRKLRKEQTASSRMTKRLKFWDNWCSFSSGGLG